MGDIDATQRVIETSFDAFRRPAGGERNNLNGRFQERHEKASMTKMGARSCLKPNRKSEPPRGMMIMLCASKVA